VSIKETANNDGVLITIFVKPNSSKFTIKYDDDNNNILVHATEEPEKGRANKEILKELTKLFQTKITLVSGATSRQKQLSVKIKKEKLEQILKKNQK
jgi:uncharacterized protein (TIGR00251 family)